MARRDKRWDLNPESLLGDEVERSDRDHIKKALNAIMRNLTLD